MQANDMERRAFVRLVSLAALSCAFPLAGCAQGQGETASIEALAVGPAFGESFQTVMDAMREEAPDAVLLAARTSTVVGPETQCSWSYLFGSQSEGCAYTAFTSEGKAYPAYLGAYEIDAGEWASIPSVDEVSVDADRALSLALDAWGGEATAENCYAYLLTHIAENEDPSAGTMKWYVEFNTPDADDEALAAAGGESPSSSAEAAFAVDARSGAVERVK